MSRETPNDEADMKLARKIATGAHHTDLVTITLDQRLAAMRAAVRRIDALVEKIAQLEDRNRNLPDALDEEDE